VQGKQSDSEYDHQLPESLSGVDIPGGLPVDKHGNFLPDQTALRLFNFFLGASGEEPDSVIRERIESYIRTKLLPPADTQAIAFLETYLDYRDAGQMFRGEIEMDGLSLEQQVQRLKQMRREVFGEEVAEKLFYEEEQMLDISIAKRRVIDDKTLSEAQRGEKLSELDKQLPEAILVARQEADKPLRIEADVASLRQQGATEEDINQLRAERFGEDAVERFQQLDNERAVLDAKVDDYLSYEKTLAEHDPVERQKMLDVYLASTLDDAERRRIPVLAGLKKNK
jgi:lipase chaperone LimK